tara:strand:- start:170 stop:814 length:645 start_codon:yes stop_codon:yes gene_type:complete
MDQDIEIINSNTRIEKIKNFFINYKKHLILILVTITLILCGFFFYQDYKLNKKEKLANQYNLLITKFKLGQEDDVKTNLINIINDKDKTYSPLAFYFLLENDLINSNEEINKYFDILINDLDLDVEIKNLVIFKKGLFNSEFAKENELLNILNPVIKSQSIWKGHALYLMGEYYFSKNEMQKSKEFFDQIVSLEKISPKIKLEAQKRLRTNFSE